MTVKGWVIANGLATRQYPAAPPAATAPSSAVAGSNPRYVSAAYEQEVAKLAAATEGTRNDTLHSVACNIAEFAKGGHIDEAAARTQLERVATAIGLEPREITATIDSAWRRTSPRVVPPPTGVADAYTLDPGRDVGGDDRFTDGASFILDMPDAPPALWGHGTELLWAEGESLMIAGPMGLGKTTLAGMLVRAQLRATPTAVLGFNVTPRPGRILYLAMDRPRQIARAFRRQFTDDDRDTLQRRLTIWQGPPPADIARHPELLTRLADEADAATVFIDSIKDAAIGLSEDEVGAGYNRARQHLLAEGRELCELHHTTKRGANGGPPSTAADIYGSAWITNGTGSIILLGGDPGDPIVAFRHVRQPMQEIGPYQLLHDQDAGELTIYHETDLMTLAAVAGPDGLTARGAAQAIEQTDQPTASQVERARRKLDKLAAAGHLVRVDGERGGSGGRSRSAWFPAAGKGNHGG